MASWAFPGGSVVKESVCQCNRLGRCRFDPWVGKIPWSRKWQPLPVLLPGKSHGQRSLVGYSRWGWEESETTEHTLRYLHDFLCPCLTSDSKPGHLAVHSLQVSSSCHSLRLCQGFSLTGSDLGLPAAVMSVYLPLLWYLTERALGL